jgi:hypothetical protein
LSPSRHARPARTAVDQVVDASLQNWQFFVLHPLPSVIFT